MRERVIDSRHQTQINYFLTALGIGFSVEIPVITKVDFILPRHLNLTLILLNATSLFFVIHGFNI